MVGTSLRTWPLRVVEAHHQSAMVPEYGGNELTGLVGQESVGSVDALDWLNQVQLADLKSYVHVRDNQGAETETHTFW